MVLFTAEIRGLCWKTTWKSNRDESCVSWLLSQHQIIKNHFMDRAVQPEEPSAGTDLMITHFLKELAEFASLL